MDAPASLLRNFSRRVRKDIQNKEPGDGPDIANDGTLTHRSSSIIRLGRRGTAAPKSGPPPQPASGSANQSSKGSRSDSNISSERGDDENGLKGPFGDGHGSPSSRLLPGALVVSEYAEAEFDRLESTNRNNNGDSTSGLVLSSSSVSSASTNAAHGGKHVKSPLFASGTGMMTTDVSDSFKRAFQQMATEREILREDLQEARRLAQEPGELRKQYDKSQEDLEEAQAAVLKERAKAVGAAKTVSDLQKEVRQLKADLAAKTNQVDALKIELESGDKKSINDLLAREKAAESAMLRKGREIDELKKSQAKLEKRLQDSVQDSSGLQNMADRAARRIQNLEESLRSESQKCLEALEARERAETNVAIAQAETSGLRLKLDDVEREASRMNREVRALNKGLESAKGEGSDAASRVSELERLLSLRTDEVSAAEKLTKLAEAKADDARKELASLQSDLGAAQQKIADSEAKYRNETGQLARESEIELDEARSSIRVLTRDLEREREMAERDREEYLKEKSKAVDDMAGKAQEAREELAAAKVELSRTQRDLALSLDQAQESAIAKEREIKFLTARLEAANGDVEDAKWHLERANAKAADIKNNAKAAEEDLKSEIHEARGRIVELQASARDAERRALDAERAAFDAKNESSRLTDKLKTVNDDTSNLRDRIRDIERDLDEACKGRNAMENVVSELEIAAKKTSAELTSGLAERDDLMTKVQSLEAALVGKRREAGDAQNALQTERENAELIREKLVMNERKIRELEHDLSEAQDARAQLVSKTADLKTLEAQYDEIMGRADELESRLTSSLSESSAIEERIFKVQSELDDSRVRLADAELVRDRALQELNELRAALTDKDDCLQQSLGNLSELENNLHSSEVDRANEKSLVSNLEATVGSLEREKAELEKVVLASQETAATRSVETDDLRKELADLKTCASRADEDRKSISATLKAMESKALDLSAQLEESNLKLNRTLCDLDAVDKARQTAEERATNSEAELSQTRAKHDEAETARSSLDAEMSYLKSRLMSTLQDLGISMVPHSDRKSEGNENLEMLNTLLAEHGRTKTDIDALRSQLEAFEEGARKFDIERLAALSQTKELETCLANRESDVIKGLTEMETARSRLTELEEGLKQADIKLSDSERARDDLSRQLDATVDSRETLENQIEVLSARLEDVTSALESAEARSSELAALEGEVHALRIELSEKEEVERDRASLQRELEAFRAEADAAAVDADAKISSLVLEQNDIERARRHAEERANSATSAAVEAAKEVEALSNKLLEAEKELEEAEHRVRDFEAEITHVTNTVTELEWSVNEQTLRADTAEDQAEKLREQGRTIYSQVEEFGEEAEARVAEAEGELQAKMEDIALLENRIDDLLEDADKHDTQLKKFEKELERLHSESRESDSARDAAERKLDSLSTELLMERERSRSHESRVNDLVSSLAIAKASDASARESLLRLEERMRSDGARMRELEGRADRLAVVEEKLDRAEMERGRARAELSVLSEAKAALELKLVQAEARMSDGSDSTRKHDQELVIYRDQALQRHPSIVESSSMTSRRRGEGKNSILVGASAFAGGLSIFAIKLLAKAASSRD